MLEDGILSCWESYVFETREGARRFASVASSLRLRFRLATHAFFFARTHTAAVTVVPSKVRGDVTSCTLFVPAQQTHTLHTRWYI